MGTKASGINYRDPGNLLIDTLGKKASGMGAFTITTIWFRLRIKLTSGIVLTTTPGLAWRL
jgi:hypothetical protein